MNGRYDLLDMPWFAKPLQKYVGEGTVRPGGYGVPHKPVVKAAFFTGAQRTLSVSPYVQYLSESRCRTPPASRLNESYPVFGTVKLTGRRGRGRGEIAHKCSFELIGWR